MPWIYDAGAGEGGSYVWVDPSKMATGEGAPTVTYGNNPAGMKGTFGEGGFVSDRRHEAEVVADPAFEGFLGASDMTKGYAPQELMQRYAATHGLRGQNMDLNKEWQLYRRMSGGGAKYLPKTWDEASKLSQIYLPYQPDDSSFLGDLFSGALEVLKPIGMTAGVGLGLGAAGGAMGLAGFPGVGAVPSLGTSFGETLSGLGSSPSAGAGGAAAGGASAAGGSSAGLGSGLRIGAGASGIGGGATGTGVLPGTISSGIGGGGLGSGIGFGAGGASSLAAGGSLGALGANYFAGESLYPVAGGKTAATLSNVGPASVSPSTAASWKNALAAGASNPSVMGALAGAMLGGSGSNGEPAGTVDSEETLPDWLMPYVKPTLDKYSTQIQNYNTDPYGIMPSAMREFEKTISGGYLDPANNKYLENYFNAGAERVKGTLSPSFGHMQAFGSHSGYNEALSRGLADLSTGIYGQAYENERSRMNSAMGAAPSFLQQSSQQAFAPYQGYLNTVGGFGKKSSQPYFEGSDWQNILGGAMTGWGLGNLFK